MGPYLVLPLRVREDLGVMSINGYSIFPRAPGHEPHHRTCHILDTFIWGGLTTH